VTGSNMAKATLAALLAPSTYCRAPLTKIVQGWPKLRAYFRALIRIFIQFFGPSIAIWANLVHLASLSHTSHHWPPLVGLSCFRVSLIITDAVSGVSVRAFQPFKAFLTRCLSTNCCCSGEARRHYSANFDPRKSNQGLLEPQRAGEQASYMRCLSVLRYKRHELVTKRMG
jgi:hypothetical protein